MTPSRFSPYCQEKIFVMIFVPEQTQRVFGILGLERLKFLVTMTDQLITVSLYSSALVYPVIQCRSRGIGVEVEGCSPVSFFLPQK